MSESASRHSSELPRIAAAIFRTMVPIAEREELLADLETEYQQRATRFGHRAARRWAWRQAFGSLPAFCRRTWWRGMTGFEPASSRYRPGGPMFESWIMDARYAWRRLLRRPVYALLAILTLALGAGGVAAIFSVVKTVLLEPLPIAREVRVGVLWFDGSWSESEFLHLRPNFSGFQRMAAYRPNDVTLERDGNAMRLLPGIAASAELFDVLGATPMLGRTFRSGEDAAGVDLAIVLSHALWQDLGSDPDIVGKTLRVGGFSRTVIGVMPRGFWFPSPETRVWTAAQLNPQNRSGRYTLVGRIADDASMAYMDGPLRAIAEALRPRFQYPPQWDKTKSPAITPAREFFVGDVRPSLVATLAAMGVLLLIACTNVAALMLGQVDARSTEMAVRTALGANRQRLIQQLVLESLVIGALAGATGVALATVAFELIVQALPLGALAETTHLDWTVFWAAMSASLVGGVLVAIVPGVALWRGSRLQATMASTRTGGIRGRGGRLEGGLVVAQMALAVLLAAGAGLLIRSVANLRAIDPGVNTRDVVVVDATMPTRLTNDERRRTILNMLPNLQAQPGVKSAAATQRLQLRGNGDNWGLSIPGKPDIQGVTTYVRVVTRDYFATMGIPILRGRTFDTSDREGNDRVVVINEALAQKFFPGEDPIGRVLQTFNDTGERIVGVVRNAADGNLTDAPAPARYMLYDQIPAVVWHQVTFVLKADANNTVPALLDAAASTIRREGSQLAVQKTTTMAAVFELSVGAAGQVVTLLVLLAGLALVLGAVGVYGVISHYVTRRARDYGIYIALGQSPGRVVRQVVGHGAALVMLGSVIGLVAALTVTQVLSSLLHGVRPTDPLTFVAAVAVLLVVGVLAAFVPARRASLTDPAIVLRQP